MIFENGAIYRGLPLHALAHGEESTGWEAPQAQRWDCYGTDWSATEYTFLRGLRAQANCNGTAHRGEYLFTVTPANDGFSAVPDQAKEFTFIRLENGRFTVQPTDKVLFEDRSFTRHDWGWPTGFRRQTDSYSCE